MKVNLTGINLNLLVTLDALLELKNTTRVAHQLNMSQSSVSKNLKSLRVIFEDELLLRGQHTNRMLLTPKAKSLIIPVKEAIEKLSAIFDVKEFDPFTAELNFRIGLTDTATIFLLPKLMELFNNLSPKSTISVENLFSISSELFDELNLFIVIGAFHETGTEIFSEPIHKINHVCIADKNHEALKNNSLTMDIFTQYPHIVVTHGKRLHFRNAYGSIFKKIFDEKKIKTYEIPYLMSALHIIKNTSCLCVISEDIAKKYSQIFGFKYFPLPFVSPPATIKMYWKKENDEDPAHIWFRNMIRKAQEEKRIERRKILNSKSEIENTNNI